ncbi:MAG TPA: cupin domain-containing protein [Firmicutes bacterium]|nr:cupin domain-containing protein [Bacillota bacterium]
MAVKVISQAQAETQHLTGRDLTWIITEEAVGAKQMSIAIMHCSPHSVVRPLHAHEDIEEVILILEGEGEAWVDGETAKFKKGDAVFFPANSRHQVRNTGDTMLVTASIFSAPTNPDSYLIYDEDVFAD